MCTNDDGSLTSQAPPSKCFPSPITLISLTLLGHVFCLFVCLFLTYITHRVR